MEDALTTRMKSQYEDRWRFQLPRRTYVVLRVDGRAFHSYCRGLDRPFDAGLAADLDTAAVVLCQEAQGAALAYVQSDEISVLLTDFAETSTEAWFDNTVQKLASVSASIVTAAFNNARCTHYLQNAILDTLRPVPLDPPPFRPATFDARCFCIPDPTEVYNYFRWRSQDARRNSISMAVQAVCSHRELQGESSLQMLEMLAQHGRPWESFPAAFRRGRTVTRQRTLRDVTYTDKRTGEHKQLQGVERHEWQVRDGPDSAEEWAWLDAHIPRYPS